MLKFFLPWCCCLSVVCCAGRAQAGDTEDFQYAAALMGEREEFAQAADKFAEVVKKNPDSPHAPQALFYRGGCLTRLKQDAAAAEAYELLIRNYQQAPAQILQEAMSYGADAWFRAGAFDKAAVLYTKLLEAYPQSSWAESALYWRGECKMRLVTGDEGANAQRQALADYALFLEKYPQSKLRADVLYAAGASAAAAKDYLAARNYFYSFATEFPDDNRCEEALYHAADSLYWQGDYNGAQEAFDVVIKKFPEGKLVPETCAGLGWCAYGLKDYARAGLAFAEAARLQKDLTKATDSRYDAGVAFELAGEGAAAARELEFVAGVQKHPRAAQALARLGGISRKAAMREAIGSQARQSTLERTADYLQRAVSTGTPGDKDWAGWAALLGDTYFDLGRFAEAAQTFCTVAEKCPQSSFSAYALYQLSLAQSEQKKYAEAAEAIRALLRNHPESHLRLQAAYAMADYQLALKEEEKARKAYLWLADEGVRWAQQNAARASGDEAVVSRELVGRAKDLSAKALLRLGELCYAQADAAGAQGRTRSAGVVSTRENMQEAAVYFSRLAKEYPQSGYTPAACLRLGEIAQSRGDFAAAAEQYDLAVNLAEMRREQETDARRREELTQVSLYGGYRGAVSLTLGAQKAQGGTREGAAREALETVERFIRAAAAGKNDSEVGRLAERARYYRAELLYLLGRKDEAAADYLACYQAQPTGQLADAALFGLGWSLSECGQKAASRGRLEELLSAFPESDYAAEALLLLAGFKREAGETDAALADLQKLKTKPGAERCSVRGAVEEGRTLNALKRYEEARSVLENILASTDTVAANAGGGMEDAQALYALSWSYWGQAEPHFTAAARAAEEMRTLAAGKDLKTLPQALQIKVQALQRSRLDELAQARKEEDKMVRALVRLVKECPDFAAAGEAHLRLGEAAYDREEYSLALGNYQRALECGNPALFDKVRYRIGWSCLRLAEAESKNGSQDGAKKKALNERALCEFAEVANNLPKSPLAGECAWRAAELLRAQGQAARALVLYEKADVLPGGAEVRQGSGYGRALCLLELSRHTEALAAFKEFIRAYPQSPLMHEANWGAGYAALQLGAVADARDFFLAAKSGDYGGEAAAKARYGLGLLALEEKNFRAAREEFRKVDVFHPQWSEVAALSLVKAAEASRELGEATAAAKDLERVLNRYGKTETAAQARQMLGTLPKSAAN